MQQEVSHWFGPYKMFHRKVNLFDRDQSTACDCEEDEQGWHGRSRAAASTRLGSRPAPSESVYAGIAADIRDSHCGYASEENVKAMVNVQRARDAQMAQSLIAAGDPDGAVLVAGAGHVRNDYGIPIYLRAKTTGTRTVSIAFVEVDTRKTQPQSHALSYPNGRLPFDYVWFTPRIDDEDPCEKFKSQFDGMKKAR